MLEKRRRKSFWYGRNLIPDYTVLHDTNCGQTPLIFSDNNWLLKVELSLFLIKQIYESIWGEEVQLHAFLISILMAMPGQLHVPGRFILEERDLDYRSMGFGGGELGQSSSGYCGEEKHLSYVGTVPPI